MFVFNLNLALRSLKERWQLTTLMVLAIAIGIGILITIQTISYNSSKPPLPGKANRVVLVQLDHRDVNATEITQLRRRPNLTYQDSMNLLKSQVKVKNKTIVWPSNNIINVTNVDVKPIQSDSVATDRNFFSIFNLEFEYGGAWSKENDISASPVIVLSKESNMKLFGGENSAGRQVKVEGNSATVVGVLKRVLESRRYHFGNFFPADPNAAFMPSSFALNYNLKRWIFMRCHAKDQGNRRSFATQNVESLKTSK